MFTFHQVKILAQETANESAPKDNKVVSEAMTRLLAKLWEIEDAECQKRNKRTPNGNGRKTRSKS